MRTKSIIFSVFWVFIFNLLIGCKGILVGQKDTLTNINKDTTLTALFEDESLKEETAYQVKESSEDTLGNMQDTKSDKSPTEQKAEIPEELEEITLLKGHAFSKDTRSLSHTNVSRPEETHKSGSDKSVTVEELQENPKKIFNIYIREANLKSVLMSFSNQTPYSFVLDPNIQGTVTMDLKEVTIEEALKEITATHGFVYEKEDNFIRIYKPKLFTRNFRLNYLPTIREGISKVEAKAPGGVDNESEKPIQITNKETADLWAEIENGIKGIISPSGTFSINKMASIITVTDFEKNLGKIAEFIETIEGTVQKQVIIEATVLEVVLTDDFQYGIDWTHLIGNEERSRHATLNMSSEDLSTTTTSVFKFSFRYANLGALIDTISKQGEVKIISKPRVTTLNNQKAVIKVGTEEVYFEFEKNYETIGDKNVAIYTVEPKFFTVGLILDVTPQISPTNDITLHIHPIYSEKKEDRAFNVSANEAPVLVPIVNIRESSSVVKVKSGETVVLGGLMMEKTLDNIAGVPVLKNLPILGNLFKHTQQTVEKTELVVTLTPKVLYGEQMEDLSDNELERLFDL